jgi:hypothetical protein
MLQTACLKHFDVFTASFGCLHFSRALLSACVSRALLLACVLAPSSDAPISDGLAMRLSSVRP